MTHLPDTSRPEVLAPHPPLRHYYHDEQERRSRIRGWFNASAADYDWISQVISFGSGHWYRRQALRRAGLKPGMQVLDVACGTGLVAGPASQMVGESGSVVGLDPSVGMLAEARRRGRVNQGVRAFAERLPFADARFDFLSMGYALRHVPDLLIAFAEYRRVLKPGGRLLLLEITDPKKAWYRPLLKFHMKHVVPLLTRVFRSSAASSELAAYYWATVEECVPPEKICSALKQAGFVDVHRHVEMGFFSEYTARSPGSGEAA